MMFHKQNDSRSESSNRTCQEPELSASNQNQKYQINNNNNDQIIRSLSNSRQQRLQSNYLVNIPKEENKSHQAKTRSGIYHSSLQQNHYQTPNINSNHNHQTDINMQSKVNQRTAGSSGQNTNTPQMPSSTNLSSTQANHNSHQINQTSTCNPLNQSHIMVSSYQPTTWSSAMSSRINNNSDNASLNNNPNLRLHQMKHRASSSSSVSVLSQPIQASNLRDVQTQHDRIPQQMDQVIKEEFDEFKECELENMDSIEPDLPVELSFLMRQQAFCMARMNYLDRQIRELKESRLNVGVTSGPNIAPQIQHQQTTNLTSNSNHQSQNPQVHRYPMTNNSTNPISVAKNGNFILSDDSGGEYSRATISDDDELSSLLDQIAKSVRPERNVVNNNHHQISSIIQNQQHNLMHQQHQNSRNSYSMMANPTQQYAIINPNQMHHHQAVPVFVMGSPIAVAHSSSINSTVLPGVHFQLEPRYNQYYEDFYTLHSNTTNPMANMPASLQRHTSQPVRSQQQFDSSISAIEQLVSQKEKRQIKSQLKSADNWLKMRSSGLANLSELNFSGRKNSVNNGASNPTSNSNDVGDPIGDILATRDLPASSSGAMTALDNPAIEQAAIDREQNAGR